MTLSSLAHTTATARPERGDQVAPWAVAPATFSARACLEPGSDHGRVQSTAPDRLAGCQLCEYLRRCASVQQARSETSQR